MRAGDRSLPPCPLVERNERWLAARRLAMPALFLALLITGSLKANDEVTPLLSRDCDQALPPEYAAPGQPPLARIWKSGADGLPPRAACMAHGPVGSELWVSVAGQSGSPWNAEALLTRFGQISQLREVKYWSVTDHQWRPLFASATALNGASGGGRSDFTLDELEGGSPLYIEQADSRSSRKVTYELRLLRSNRQGFVVSTVNVSPVQWWAVTLYKPGELETLYFLDHTGGDQWRFYSLSRMAPGSRLFSAQDGSYINRTVALYRFFVGIPTDAEPPAAP